MTSKDAVRCRILCLIFLWIGAAAKHATPNFDVDAPTSAIAEKVAQTAERYRRELAVEWLGHELPNWSARCKVAVKVGQIGAGGATTFSFANGEVFGWNMTVQGSLERILDSVIPHEVSHTIFACHFRRPLPRWADEGAATLAEEDSERRRQQKLAEEVMPTKRRIPLRELLQITEYPKDMQHVLTLYAEGFSLADYLVQQKGKHRFLTFVQDAHEFGWDEALRKHYNDLTVNDLENQWSRWVIAGSPTLNSTDNLIADAGPRGEALSVRSQTPDESVQREVAREPAVKSVTLADSDRKNDGGHSIGLRGESVSAPAPKNLGRSKRSTDETASVPSPFSVAVDGAEAVLDKSTKSGSIDSRLSRGSLSRPELRQSATSISRLDSSDLSPSPFDPVVTHEANASDESFRSSVKPTDRTVGRSIRQTVPVQSVQDRKSSLRFKPFPSR